ncbi:MAG: 2-oxoacid:acceptor oxidoreductase family protein [Peptostreptococcaceae bacterium]|nr:2-oxoacid:acceptor oxidoreductase family protein [Peptostreptococcaceae bacterium]
MIEIRWHGRGGQGSFTASRILGAAASVHGGKYSMAFPSFGPERRGAPVAGFTRISDEKITDRSEIISPDYVIVLDETLWENGVLNGLKEDTILIINTDKPNKYEKLIPQKVISVDATSIALDVLGLPITNTAMMGAFIAVSGLVTLEDAKKAIDDNLKPKVAKKNKELIEKVYELVKGAQ